MVPGHRRARALSAHTSFSLSRTPRLLAASSALAILAPVLLLGGRAQAAGAHPHASSPAFDVKLYESYVMRHHRKAIPYRDHAGHVTRFAQAWMKHRKLCGGAISGESMNPTTLSTLQEWQGCTAVEKIGSTTISFTKAPWIS